MSATGPTGRVLWLPFAPCRGSIKSREEPAPGRAPRPRERPRGGPREKACAMPHSSLRTHGCRVSDEWTHRGMRAAVLENELLRVLVLLDRGAEIVEFRYKPLDL